MLGSAYSLARSLLSPPLPRFFSMASADPPTAVLSFHEATKHNGFGSYARSKDIHWGSQPYPFRSFDRAPLIPLSFLPSPSLPFSSLFDPPSSSSSLPLAHLLSHLFFHSMSLSATKQSGAYLRSSFSFFFLLYPFFFLLSFLFSSFFFLILFLFFSTRSFCHMEPENQPFQWQPTSH